MDKKTMQILEEQEKTIARELRSIHSIEDLQVWLAKNKLGQHPLFKKRYAELLRLQKSKRKREEEMEEDNDELFRVEDRTILRELEELSSSQEVREWGRTHGMDRNEIYNTYVQEMEERKEMERDNDLLSTMVLTPEKRQKKGKHFQCSKCGKVFNHSQGRAHHQRHCTGQPITLRQYECNICKKSFASVKELKQHREIEHGDLFECQECQSRFPSMNALQHHRTTTHRRQPAAAAGSSGQRATDAVDGRSSPEAGPSYVEDATGSSQEAGPSHTRANGFKCRKCRATFPSRKALYLHGMRQHGSGETKKNLKPEPWGTGPPAWVSEEGESDGQFEEVYRANAPFILTPDRPDAVHATFNVPINGHISQVEILNQVRAICRQQDHAFRINFMFGMILRNVETGDLRYFIPDQNETLFDQAVLVNSMQDIRRKIAAKLEQVDIFEYLLRQRPDSKWKPFFLTNMKIVIFKTNFVLGNGGVQLPAYIRSNRSIVSLSSTRNGRPYQDNLCAFRCLATHRGQRNMKTATNMLFREWVDYLLVKGIADLSTVRPDCFAGVNFGDLESFEACFQTNVNLFKLSEDGTARPAYRTMGRYNDTMHLNLYENHLSYISNIKAYTKKYACSVCEKMFTTSWACLKHERTCDGKTRFSYPGGFYELGQTVFDKLEEYGIVVPPEDRFYPWFIAFDFEALLKPDFDQRSDKLRWCTQHVPISVSICSNVDGFREPECFVDADTDRLVKRMVDQMEVIASAASELAREKWEPVLSGIEEQLESWAAEEGVSGQMMVTALKSLRTRVQRYCAQVPVLGFNSARYDLNLIKKTVAKHLRLDDPDNAGMTVKRNNSYTCISSQTLKFLDVTQFLAPGNSYSAFLKAYGVEESKGFFPYEYLTDAAQLEETSLPKHEAFFSSLKGKNISAAEYDFCLRVWEEHNMSTLRDFLVWYNNLDVGPFVKAVERLQAFYFDRHIDVFKVAMSVPGIARQMLFRSGREAGASFALIDERDKDLFHTIKNNIIGGPSIIFNRHAKVGETFIRNNRQKPCNKILGYDANALYLWALDQPMPTSSFVRRKADNGFRPEVRDKYMSAYHWMDWLSHISGRTILHKLNHGREKRVGPYPVDGYCPDTNAIFQFQGCYHHGHSCHLTRNLRTAEQQHQQRSRLEKTERTTAYLRAKGYTVTEIWECEFRELVRNSDFLQKFISARRPQFFRQHPGPVTHEQILAAVREGKLFGMVEVDIQVPDQWASGFERELSPYDYFEEMAPLFCTTDIPFTVIGDHMRDYVERNNLSKQPRRLLVGGMKGRKMLLATPLLKWYLEHGMEVTNIHQVVEYTPLACFKEFVRQVSEARRQGDADTVMSVIADTMKLIGNSAYGGLIMDKTKHRKIVYVRGDHNASQAVNDRHFRNMTKLGDDVYELEMSKPKIKFDLPIQLGYFILQYAKLRMLEFYYDFMDVYVDRSDFVYCEMDTDSAYMAISGTSLEEVIKPEMRPQFDHGLYGFCDGEVHADAQFHWMPRGCCNTHAKFDKRTPGLFKLEFSGEEIIGLCSKTYAARNKDTVKFSAKGVQKKTVTDPFSIYESVLKTQQPRSGFNKGFRARNNTIYTYEQERCGFSYFYCKREVLPNGIDTKVLDIVLCPEPKDPEDVMLVEILVDIMNDN